VVSRYLNRKSVTERATGAQPVDPLGILAERGRLGEKVVALGDVGRTVGRRQIRVDGSVSLTGQLEQMPTDGVEPVTAGQVALELPGPSVREARALHRRGVKGGDMSRRIIAFDNVSADGYFTSADEKLDWVVQDDEVDRSAASHVGQADTILFGRKTYDLFAAFWPKALDDPQGPSDPHAPGRRSDAIRTMARWLNEAKKLVFSRHDTPLTWHNSRYMGELDPKEIEALKRGPGGDMMIFGSGTIVSRLAEQALIDEFQFLVNPIVLGAGRPLLDSGSIRTPLRLMECTAFPSGKVLLRYFA
jgi:dihydrofolate reductase